MDHENNIQLNSDPAGDGNQARSEAKGINWKSALISAAVFLVIIVGTFVFLYNSSELRFSELKLLIGEMSLPWLLLGLGCLFMHVYSEGRAIASVAHAVGVRIGHVKSTLFACVEMFFAGITPSASGGQPATAYFMYKEGIRVSKSSAILLMNTFQYTVSLLLLSTGALIYSRDLVAAESAVNPTFKVLLILGYVANILGLICCLLFIFAPSLVRFLARPAYKLLAKMHVIKDLDAKLVSLEEAIDDYGQCHKMILRNPVSQLKTLFWNVCQKLFVCAIAYCIYRGLGYKALGLIDVVCIQLLIQLTVNALPLPGSAGATELITRGLYRSIYAAAHAVPAMIFYRSVSFYLLVIIGGVVSAVYYSVIVRRGAKRSGN